MKHSIYNPDLETSIVVDETNCENTSICVKSYGDIDGKTHYLTPSDLENLIHLLKYIQAKKKEINPIYGKRISALSIASIKAMKSNKLTKKNG